MLFNSGIFLQFFTAFLLLYYAVRNHLAARNWLIVIGSYIFYGWWDYRFLALIFISSLIDFSVGLGLDRPGPASRRKALVTASIVANLTILGFFKYYDFFVDSLANALAEVGIAASLPTLGIILPVGISFYTFQTMSYAIDVYRGEMKPTRDFGHFLAYVSFFPQLVAGPIERARHLLPQFGRTLAITGTMVAEGFWLCVWGLFKKVVLADNLAPLVEMVYDHPNPGAAMVVLGTLAFGFQIYCDFSGYSDIARGLARFLGFDIMVNFNLPYAAENLREFWRRWHISLSTWLRDYLYLPLGGSRSGLVRTCLNLLITMLLGGLWHGAAWNFVGWGLWHGIGLTAHRLWWERRKRAATPGGRMVSWLFTMLFVFYGWLLFRAGSWDRIVSLSGAMADLTLPVWAGSYCWNFVVFTLPLVAVQIWQHRTGDLLAPLRLGLVSRAMLQGAMLVGILLFWQKEKVPFIYFQF